MDEMSGLDTAMRKVFDAAIVMTHELCRNLNSPERDRLLKAVEDYRYRAVVSEMEKHLDLRVLSWLGYWRDKFPAEAVTALQEILLKKPAKDLQTIAQEPRYCVKCGVRQKLSDPAHAYICTGSGNSANPAPFRED